MVGITTIPVARLIIKLQLDSKHKNQERFNRYYNLYAQYSGCIQTVPLATGMIIYLKISYSFCAFN